MSDRNLNFTEDFNAAVEEKQKGTTSRLGRRLAKNQVEAERDAINSERFNQSLGQRIENVGNRHADSVKEAKKTGGVFSEIGRFIRGDKND